jgi:hypothetical protein
MKPFSMRGRRRGSAGRAGRPRGELLVEMREEHAGEVAHRLRVQEIMLHEALDRRGAGAVGIMHPLAISR